jgi:hypothetical protein
MLLVTSCPNPGTEIITKTETVYRDSIDRITVSAAPAKTNYPQDAPFSGAGLGVTAHFTDGTTTLVTSGIALSWNGQALADGSAAITADPGSKDITVTWRGKTASFPILVAAADGSIAPITSAGEWTNAMNHIKEGGNGKSYILTIDGSFEVPASNSSSATFGTVNDLVVTLKGNGTLTLDANGTFFALWGSSSGSPAAQQKLVIDGNVTLQGKTGNNAAVVYVYSNAVLDMKGGKISGNNNTISYGGGVLVYTSGSFAKSGGGIIYGDTDNTHTPGSTENTTIGGSNIWGHAVYYYKDSGYYRNDTLGAGDDISTGTLPTATGSGNSVGNWIKK